MLRLLRVITTISLFSLLCSTMPTLGSSAHQRAQKDYERQKTKSRKRSRRDSKTEEGRKKRKTISNMEYAELKESKDRCLKKNDTFSAIKFLEIMVPICENLNERKDIMLELADLHFQDGKLAKAENGYREFVQLYPGSSKVEYASYKAILSSYYTILSADRDQTKTKDTITMTETFLDRGDIFIKYDSEVKKIQKQCFTRLFDSEVNIINFQLKRGSTLAAQNRIAGLRKELLPKLPGVEPQILVLECDFAVKTNNTKLAQEKRTLLAKKFPALLQPVKVAAHKKGKRKRFSSRF